jgi:hypothetical protein
VRGKRRRFGPVVPAPTARRRRRARRRQPAPRDLAPHGARRIARRRCAEPAACAQRERVAAPFDARHIAQPRCAELVECVAQIGALGRGERMVARAICGAGLRQLEPGDGFEPAIRGRVCAQLEQVDEGAQPATRRAGGSPGSVSGERYAEAGQLLAQRQRVALEIASHHGDALGHGSLVQQAPQAIGHGAHLGVRAGRLDPLDARRRQRRGRLE